MIWCWRPKRKSAPSGHSDLSAIARRRRSQLQQQPPLLQLHTVGRHTSFIHNLIRLVRSLRTREMASISCGAMNCSLISPGLAIVRSGAGVGAKCCWASSFRGISYNLLPEVRTERQSSRKAALIRSHQETAEVAVSRTACPAVKAEVDVSTFESLDIRVGLITDAKAVPDPEMSAKRGVPTMSRKHLELTVDIGCEQRIVVSECKYVMDVEDAVGKKVLLVANIPPTEVLGITSHGMLLTGFNYDPTPMPRSFKVILPGLGRLPPGSEVKGAGTPT